MSEKQIILTGATGMIGGGAKTRQMPSADNDSRRYTTPIC